MDFENVYDNERNTRSIKLDKNNEFLNSQYDCQRNENKYQKNDSHFYNSINKERNDIQKNHLVNQNEDKIYQNEDKINQNNYDSFVKQDDLDNLENSSRNNHRLGKKKN